MGLSNNIEVWRSTETELSGWALVLNRWPYRDEQHIVTVAARRRDVAREPVEGESGESNWYLSQRFADYQAPLAARYAIPRCCHYTVMASVTYATGREAGPNSAVQCRRLLDSTST